MTERETRINDMNESKTGFISGETPFLPVDRDTTVPVAQCNGLCHVTQTLSRHTVSLTLAVRIRPFCDARRRRNAQRHDAQRRNARRPCHPDDDDTPDVKRKRRLEGLALAVCFIPKSQTCNSYKINPFR